MLNFDIKIEVVPILWCDNIGAKALYVNPVFHSMTKHIEVDVHFIREKVAAKVSEVRYVPTELQKADLFTKTLSGSWFCFLRDNLSLKEPQLRLRGNVKDRSEADVAG